MDTSNNVRAEAGRVSDLCVYHQKVNAVSKQDVYTIARMNECIDSIGEAFDFSALIGNSGYWKDEFEKEDRQKTVFTLHFELYRLVRMPLGLQNALSTFQRTMEAALSAAKCKLALFYQDNVVELTPSLAAQVELVKHVLLVLCKAGVAQKLKTVSSLRKVLTTLATSSVRGVSELRGIGRVSFVGCKLHSIRPTGTLS